MDEKVAGKVMTLLSEVYDAGIKEGRVLERRDLVASLQKEPAPVRSHHRQTRPADPPQPPPAQNRFPDPEPEPEPATPTAAPPTTVTQGGPTIASTITDAVTGALMVLGLEAPDGVFPDSIVTHLKDHPNGHGVVDAKAVRSALRQMTMSGEVRRLQRGRYVLTTQPPEPGTLMSH
jgi:pyruvate/2-oxoglutarate dehydrogenase complex dihydrolipoamide acyltransferase (E2) component